MIISLSCTLTCIVLSFYGLANRSRDGNFNLWMIAWNLLNLRVNGTKLNFLSWIQISSSGEPWLRSICCLYHEFWFTLLSLQRAFLLFWLKTSLWISRSNSSSWQNWSTLRLWCLQNILRCLFAWNIKILASCAQLFGLICLIFVDVAIDLLLVWHL